LQRATEIEPDNADYHFWQGVGYWAIMDFDMERTSYLKALNLDRNHVPAHLYLGHNFLDSGSWEEALGEYDEVLDLAPYNPEALYNRGLALAELQRPEEEMEAWQQYLKYYPEGKWTLRAVDNLNALGDFSHRNFTIGYRRVTLESIAFAPNTARLMFKSKPSLHVLGSILSINQKIELEIVGHKQGDATLAEARAKAVQDYLLKRFPAIEPSRLQYRGEGDSERVEIDNRDYLLDDSISFVTTKK
jgi:tetratricopeptide (TPR) repeat protein